MLSSDNDEEINSDSDLDNLHVERQVLDVTPSKGVPRRVRQKPKTGVVHGPVYVYVTTT